MAKVSCRHFCFRLTDYTYWLCKVSLQHLCRCHCKLYTHTHTPVLTALCLGLPGWASTRKVKPIWILLKQETVSGSGISCTICKSAPCSIQITTPAPHHSVFYTPDALPAAQPTASKHWRKILIIAIDNSSKDFFVWNTTTYLVADLQLSL